MQKHCGIIVREQTSQLRGKRSWWRICRGPLRAVPKCGLSLWQRCPGASNSGSSSNQGQEHHHGETEANTGSLGAAVISFQEQITFPAAKDMLCLNKNDNSQQIELGTGRVVVASPRKPLPVPAGSVAVSEEAEGCAKGCGVWIESRSMGRFCKTPAPHVLKDPASAPRLPVPCPSLA